MSRNINQFVEQSDAPTDHSVTELDVRQFGPPKPLTKTLERLTELDDEILVQHNDRAPQHLYPKLEDRGYNYETFETDEMFVTIIW